MTINPNQDPVWRPTHDLAHAHQLSTDPTLAAYQAMIDEARWQQLQRVEEYRGYPALQEAMIAPLVQAQVAVQATEQAAARLDGIAKRTSLVQAETLSAHTGNEVRVKLENEQPVGSFKLRGAFNMIAAIPPHQRQRGVIGTSAGNHAQGVGFAAQHFGIGATIFMQRTAPEVKINAVEKLGVKVMLHGETFDEADAACRRFLEQQQESGHDTPILVPPFDHPLVIFGQGTVGKEIVEQFPEVEYVLVQCGGGGLGAGVAQYVKSLLPDVKIITVEPAHSNAFEVSHQLGKRVLLQTVDTIAEGLAVSQVGEQNFALLQQHVDGAVSVSDGEIMEAMRAMDRDIGVRAEASGAAGYAAVQKLGITGKKIAVICTGSNIAPEKFAAYTATDTQK